MSKNCTDDYRALDVRKIKRAGRLIPGSGWSWIWSRNGETVATIAMQAGTGNVRLIYRQRTHGGEWRDMAYTVWLAYTPCNLGGQRVWWQCPGAGCGRRVAVLYGGAGIFACRHCYRLAYRSQRDHNAFRPADKLRAQLGWVPGVLNESGGRPKGMHFKTYIRLLDQYHTKAARAMAYTSEKLGLLRGLRGRTKL